MLSELDEFDEVITDPNLASWKVASVTSNKIEIDLVFREALLVSQGDLPSVLLV